MKQRFVEKRHAQTDARCVGKHHPDDEEHYRGNHGFKQVYKKFLEICCRKCQVGNLTVASRHFVEHKRCHQHHRQDEERCKHHVERVGKRSWIDAVSRHHKTDFAEEYGGEGCHRHPYPCRWHIVVVVVAEHRPKSPYVEPIGHCRQYLRLH